MGNMLVSGITTLLVRGLLSSDSLDEIMYHANSDIDSSQSSDNQELSSLLTDNEEDDSSEWEILFI